MSIIKQKVEDVLSTVPARFRGPGGAVAVLEGGKLIGQRVWGYADLELRIPLTANVLFPICSITKQFVSLLIYDLSKRPPPQMEQSNGTFDEQMAARLRELLPAGFKDDQVLTVDDLVSMCSGIRDYWALCTVQGSRETSPYLIAEHNAETLRKVKTLHFAPGSEYSYSNVNFNLVERLLEHVTKDSLSNLLKDRVLQPAGMATAQMCARTDRLPAPIVGYEGSEDFGFFAAPNFIEWSADAGLGASLNDMIAYESWFDKRWTEEEDFREKLTPRRYKNGATAKYRYGLGFSDFHGMTAIGHGGALRGFKLGRRYLESKRLSVVVLFNHHGKSGDCVDYIMKQLLDLQESPAPAITAHKDWYGSYLDAETQLAVRVSPVDKSQGKVKLLYARSHETLKLKDESHAESNTMEASIHGDSLEVHRKDDNRVLKAKRLVLQDAKDRQPVLGRFYCSETESYFQVEGEGDMLYGMFDGSFGRGPPHLMKYLGSDVWVLADPRAMDDSPPGDWTIVFNRGEKGNVKDVTIGCWLARGLKFAAVGK